MKINFNNRAVFDSKSEAVELADKLNSENKFIMENFGFAMSVEERIAPINGTATTIYLINLVSPDVLSLINDMVDNKNLPQLQAFMADAFDLDPALVRLGRVTFGINVDEELSHYSPSEPEDEDDDDDDYDSTELDDDDELEADKARKARDEEIRKQLEVDLGEW